MTLLEIFRTILLVLLIVCAIVVNLTPNLLQAVVIFMSYSSIMCVIWLLMESPDLAITEAAVGAGISGTLFLMTLKKIRASDSGDDILAAEQGEEPEPGAADGAEAATGAEIAPEPAPETGAETDLGDDFDLADAGKKVDGE